MYKKFLLSFILLTITLFTYAQIPIKKFYPSVFKIDSSLHKEMTDSGFSYEFNRWVQVADMNNDGKLDFITQPYMHNKRRDGVLSVFFNTSKDTIPLFKNYKKYSTYTLGDPGQFSIGDVNDDGKLDILEPTENYHGADSNKSKYLYPNGGDHTPDKLYIQTDTGFKTLVFPDNFNTQSANLYDFSSNNKGGLSIVVANYTKPSEIDQNIKVPVINPSMFPDLNWNDHVAGRNTIYDFNLDGIPDIISYKRINNLSPLPPIFYINDYTGKTLYTFNLKEFKPNVRDSLNNVIYDYADLNGDGKLDIVLSYMGEWWLGGTSPLDRGTGRWFGINTFILYNKGDMNFDVVEVIDDPTYVQFNVTLFDWDFDGKIDFLTSSMQDGLYYKNMGGNHFEKRNITPLFQQAMNLKGIDFDKDGKKDFVNLYVNEKDENGRYVSTNMNQTLTVVTKNGVQNFPVVGKTIEKNVYIGLNTVSAERFNMLDGDGDGDLDLEIGYIISENGSWSYLQEYYENNGSQFVYKPNFIENDKTLYGELQAWTYDIDKDGDLDLFYPTYQIGNNKGYFWWENTGIGFKINKKFNLNFLDSNLLYQYELPSNKDTLIRKTIFGGQNNSSKYFIRSGQIRSLKTIRNPNELNNYFSLSIYGKDKEDTIRVLAFKKSANLSIYEKCDTVATIPINYITKNGYSYYYTPVNDWGMFVTDLNKDGKYEVVTEEFVNKYNGPYDINIMPASSRIQVYDKTGNVSNNFLDSALQYDPQMISNTNGITLTDINGDGLDDILPFGGWGWWSWQHPETAAIDFERLNKRILLNDGTKLKSFTVDLSKQTTDFINQQIGYAYYYPMNIDTSQEKSILVVKGLQSSGSTTSLDAVPAIKLDFTQFKFPCAQNLPKYNFTGNTFLCGTNDSTILKIDSVVGYKTTWQVNNQLKSTSTQIILKDSGTIKLSITNLGGCSIDKIIKVAKYAIPTAPSLVRDTANYLLSGAPGTTWYKDGTALSDTVQKYKPTTPGSYTAKTTLNGCTSVMSAAYYYLVTDIINLSKDEYIKLAPNPFINQLNFDFVVKGYQRLNIEVFDVATGNKVASQPNLTAGSRIALGQLAGGTYIIRVTSNDNKIVQQFKVVKM